MLLKGLLPVLGSREYHKRYKDPWFSSGQVIAWKKRVHHPSKPSSKYFQERRESLKVKSSSLPKLVFLPG